MGWARKRADRRSRKANWTTPEREKNGRKRRILLSKADTGKKWRYGMDTERID